MSDLEKYHYSTVEQDLVKLETPTEAESDSPNMFGSIFRRWYIILLIVFVLCAAGLPAIWLLIKPSYEVTGMIHIAPIVDDILSGERDPGEISDYAVFMNTQAARVTSSQVVERVADQLKDNNLSFFSEFKLIDRVKRKLQGITSMPERAWMLNKALMDGIITVTAPNNSEYIVIRMVDKDSEEAKLIVDAFINAYKDVALIDSTQEEDDKLTALEAELDVKSTELINLREDIHERAQEYGTDDLSNRQNAIQARIDEYTDRLTEMESQRINLEAEIRLIERSQEQVSPGQLTQMRQEYISQDPYVEALTADIAEIQQQLTIAKMTFKEGRPEIIRQEELLDSMKEQLEQAKNQAAWDFNDILEQDTENASQTALNTARSQLLQLQAYEALFNQRISEEDANAIKVGRLQQEIKNLQDRLELTKERYDEIQMRIQDLEMKRKRPARITIQDYASIREEYDKRVKYSAGLVFGSFVFGSWLAYLMDKRDKRLWRPADVAKRVGIRIIGTTTSLDDVKPSLLSERVIGDYQTIRANLGMLEKEGMPKKLVITSPGNREGKTTFAVNLATSMAESGKRVLLIDGDLRKPDVSRLLNLPLDCLGLEDVLGGVKFERVVYSIPSTGLDVLGSNISDAVNAYEFLALPSTAKRIDEISQMYDNVIIDTPAALSFPDALMWAKIGDAVILTSFAGQTTLPTLQETKERLLQINARVLGIVISSVELEHSYYHQNYN